MEANKMIFDGQNKRLVHHLYVASKPLPSAGFRTLPVETYMKKLKSARAVIHSSRSYSGDICGEFHL